MTPHPGDDGPREPAEVPGLVVALRDDLTAAGYTVHRVEGLLGPVARAALMRDQILPADLATRDHPGALAVLVRVFALGRTVTRGALDAALPALGTSGAVELGLVELAQGAEGAEAGVRPRCDLRPYGDEAHDWWVASDLSEASTGVPLLPTHVLGIGAASTTAAQWTIRRRVRSALDLGTGCGVQSLHLADHAERIVATDVSARALAYARFNATLAEIDLDLRDGSLLDPVEGERFDLVVSNPPFVITPRGEGVPLYEYRDGGLVGDGLVESLVRDVGEHLEPGGVAQFLGNWEVAAGASWRERWTGWLHGTGLDAFVVQREQQDPAEYAELWARDGGSRPGVDGFTDLYAAWLADFSARGVERIGFGVVTLQRPTTERDPWVDLVEVTGPVAPALGATVEAALAARTWLAEHDDADLLAVSWRCADDVTQESHGRFGEEDATVVLARQGGGLRRDVRLDTVTAGLLSVCDGTLPAAVALAAIAVLLERDAGAVVSAALPFLRDLVADGLLVR
ncbi:MAG: class I SAM-dependent methyltransferase [Actinomycetota bacterium]|nr:class I SAM-dependent methyltransferase [Actinomycetota bacterium]